MINILAVIDAVIVFWLIALAVYCLLWLMDRLTAKPEPKPWDFTPISYSPHELFLDLQRVADIEGYQAVMLRSGALTVNEARAEAGIRPTRYSQFMEYGCGPPRIRSFWHTVAKDC
jgi:hypothetical protein